MHHDHFPGFAGVVSSDLVKIDPWRKVTGGKRNLVLAWGIPFEKD